MKNLKRARVRRGRTQRERAARTSTAPAPTLDDALLPFLDQRLATGDARASTIFYYKARYHLYVAPRLGKRPVTAVTSVDLGALIQHLLATGRSPSTARQVI